MKVLAGNTAEVAAAVAEGRAEIGLVEGEVHGSDAGAELWSATTGW